MKLSAVDGVQAFARLCLVAGLLWAVLCGCTALAASDGKLGATSTGTVNITVTILPRFDFQAMLQLAMDASEQEYTLSHEKTLYADLLIIASK